jgi:hypothetical protein
MMPENINPFQTLKSADQHGILFEEIKKAKLGQYKKIYSGFKYIVEKMHHTGQTDSNVDRNENHKDRR